MGAGSSVPPLPSEKSAAGLAGRPANVDHQEMQGGVQWLLTVVDKEKEEKAWLAKKFEDKCMEVKSLQQELQRVRALLDQRGSTSPIIKGPDISNQELSPSKAKPIAQRRGLQLSIQTQSQPKVAFQTNKTEPLSRAKSSPALSGDGIEPMSALLRRRKEDWTPIDADQSESRGLSVSTDKVFSLLGECPASPKRVRHTSKE
ncbi:unnamed protein product [Durusdinium trenchii]|uniref:Uncharacterized protein n=1 Tax=Durusdinium trenchii TaxID=1381693 RepID=A0ABP0SYN9_9DINO